MTFIILSLILILLIIFIKFKYNITELIFSMYKADISRYNFYLHTTRILKKRLPKQYTKGYRFIISILIGKLRIGFTLK